MALQDELTAQLAKLNQHIDRRSRRSRLLNRYYDASAPPPQAIIQARVTQAYRRLVPLADAPWGAIVVDAVQDRLEVAGIRSGSQAADKKLWNVWQENEMDRESKLLHDAALISGRAYALVWPGQGDDGPQISLDNAEQMIVMYQEGSRRKRVAALRRWLDEDTRTPYCTLYRPDGVYKFVGPKNTSGYAGTQWLQRQVPGETWPLANPVAPDIPVVELSVNRRLVPGQFPDCKGEFEPVLGLIDRVNLLTFLGLVVAFWQGFPVRAVIGDRILRDDHNEPIAPFKAMANEVIQLENPNARLDSYKEANRSNLSIFNELNQLAMLTKTPRHAFPYEGGMHNISADAIRADEGALYAKVVDHKADLADGWEEVLRLAGKMLSPQVSLPPQGELLWMDHESRSLAERADAAVKLNAILPWQVIAERVLNATQDEISRWEQLRLSAALDQLVKAAQQPAPPAQNGTTQNGGPPPDQATSDLRTPASRTSAPPTG